MNIDEDECNNDVNRDVSEDVSFPVSDGQKARYSGCDDLDEEDTNAQSDEGDSCRVLSKVRILCALENAGSFDICVLQSAKSLSQDKASGPRLSSASAKTQSGTNSVLPGAKQTPASIPAFNPLASQSTDVLEQHRRKSSMPKPPSVSSLQFAQKSKGTSRHHANPLGSSSNSQSMHLDNALESQQSWDQEDEQGESREDQSVSQGSRERLERGTGKFRKPAELTIKWYSPATQAVLLRSKIFMRGEIALEDAFPDAREGGEELATEVLTYAINEACKISGRSLQEESRSLLITESLNYPLCSLLILFSDHGHTKMMDKLVCYFILIIFTFLLSF